jgi:hypothetical protein
MPVVLDYPEVESRVESTDMGEFARVMAAGTVSSRGELTPIQRVGVGAEGGKNGLAGLVLTLVKLLHELVEKQAIRRIDSGNLTDEEVERLGFTLMRQAQEISRMCKEFGLNEDELNLDLGPLGKLL